MADYSNMARSWLRRASYLLLPPILVGLSVLVLVAQFSELGAKGEILPLSSFVVLLSFSALAFNWSRVAPSLASEATLKQIYRIGVDLLLASLLALVATFFAWLGDRAAIPAALYLPIFILHWIFLFICVLLFLLAALSLVKIAKSIEEEEK